MIQRLIQLFFIVTFTSCVSYQPINIDVLMPAEHSIPPEIKSVVLVDNSLSYRDSLVNKVEVSSQKFYIDTIWNDKFSQKSLESLKNELLARNFFDTVYLHPAPLRLGYGKTIKMLKTSQIDSLCRLYNAEAVIAIEKYNYHTNIKVIRANDEMVIGTMDANGGIYWQGYDGINNRMMFADNQIDTIYWDAYGVNLAEVADKLPNIKEGMEDLADYLGVNEADKIAPYWVSQKRGYYDSGNYYFMQAAENVRKNNWGEAIKLWKYTIDHSEDRIKAQAAYNLAVASEIYGDMESVNYWLNEAVGIYSKMKNNRYMEERLRLARYYDKMKKRSAVIKKLNVQMGGGQ